MKRLIMTAALGLAMSSHMAPALAVEPEDEITMEVLEDDSAATVEQRIDLPEPEQLRARERERLRFNQAEVEEALREERQDMQERRTQAQEQAGDQFRDEEAGSFQNNR